MKIHEICWILDIDESDSTAIFGVKWPNPPLARTSHVLNILTGRVTLDVTWSKTIQNWYHRYLLDCFPQILGKPPKTVGFPGWPSAAIFRFKTSTRVGYGLKSYVMNHSMTCRSCGKPSNQSRLQPVSRSVHLGCSGSTLPSNFWRWVYPLHPKCTLRLTGCLGLRVKYL